MNLPFYKFFPADFDADEHVRAMNDCELGLYTRCLNHAWLNDGLPADPEEIRRVLRDTPKEFSQKWQRVEPCFPPGVDGRRRNPRQERERSQAVEKSQKASASAKRSHNGRRADAKPTQSGRSARASESVSDSVSQKRKSGERGSEPTAAPDTAVVPADEFFEARLFEELMGLFIAFGHGISINDRITCENHWKGLLQAERRRAHAYAMSQRETWQSRPTEAIPRPWNYLKDKQWEREAPRLLPQTRGPSRVDAAQDEARRRFLGGER